MDEQGNIIKEQKFKTDEEEIQRFVKSLKAQKIRTAIEATCTWYHVYETLNALGVETTLENMRRTKTIAESKIKTDKLDAKTIAQCLRTGFIATAYIPPKTIMEKRNLLRHRMSLRKEIIRYKNKIHAILLRNGIPTPDYSDLFGVVIVEKRVEVPVEVIKEVEKIVEVRVEVVKEIEKVITITNNKELEEKIFHLNEQIESEGKIFSTKTQEMENNFQKEMAKKDEELAKLRQTLDIPLYDNKVKMLQQTIQNLNIEIRELKKKNEELNKKLLEQSKQVGDIPAKFHGSSNLSDNLYK